MERRIVSTTILVEWSDNPKPVVLNNDMPDGLRQDFDDWLTEIEEEQEC
jgi:chemotaxis response regulator CheB